MQKYTLADIRRLGIQYDLTKIRGVEEDWEGTLEDIVHWYALPVEDRLLIILQLLSFYKRLKFSCWAAYAAFMGGATMYEQLDYLLKLIKE